MASPSVTEPLSVLSRILNRSVVLARYFLMLVFYVGLGWAMLPHMTQAGETTLVSVNSAGVAANFYSFGPSLSADGRYVAFGSLGNNLVVGDYGLFEDIFVHDRVTGETTRVSVNSASQQANGYSFDAAISADGRYVAFASEATNLVAGDDRNGAPDIFVHDRVTGETTRVSVSSAGQYGHLGSQAPSLSADGRYVAFESQANNLVIGDTNRGPDIFVHDRMTRETTRVNVNSAGQQDNRGGRNAAISADGRYVAFESFGTNLVIGDTNGVTDIFVHDRLTGETTRVSVDSAGQQSNDFNNRPMISADGRYVAFESAGNNLAANDTNLTWDIFLHDRVTGQTARVSVNSAGQQANGSSQYAAISADGRYVAFESYANNLVSGDTNDAPDIFVHERATGETTRVSVNSVGQQANGYSDRESSLSADGRYVAFWSTASNLVATDTYGGDIFVHDRDAAPPGPVSLHHFTFAPIPVTVDPNTPFYIRITARDSSGNIYPYMGKLILNNLLGIITPAHVDMIDGQWGGLVQVDTSGTGNVLSVSGGGASGNSNTFTVTGATDPASLVVFVQDQQKRSLSGRNVYLDSDGDGIPDRHVATDGNGKAEWSDLQAGNVTVWAREPDGSHESPHIDVQLIESRVALRTLEINRYEGQRTPVLLVPGILGSYQNWGFGFAPNLGSYPVPRQHLELFDPSVPGAGNFGLIGWTDLMLTLKFDECTAFGKAPFDWRMPVEEVVNTYLVPAIQDLKLRTGSPKVNIVAHSTGGLVARAYIQSKKYAGDINKLAMVGTPNMGAVNAYYMWEGGDPLRVDNMTGNDPINPYWEATEELYEDTYGLGKLHSWDNEKIRQFYRDHVREIRDLLPTFNDFLVFPTGPAGIVTASNQNSMLDDLNADEAGKSKMSPTGADGTVKTVVLYSGSEGTIRSHKAYWPFGIERYDTGLLYEDGVPQPYIDPVKTDGDGTVLSDSATLPKTEGWADGVAVDGGGSHAFLVRNAIDQLVEFLREEGEPACAP